MILYIEKQGPSVAERRRLKRLHDHFGHRWCDEIDQGTIDEYLRQQHPNAKAATRIRQAIRPLSTVLRVAAKRRWCDKPDFERPRVDEFDGARALTYNEADRLVTAAAPHLKPLLIFMLGTGARTNDCLRLRWEQVDLAGQRVTFLTPKGGRPYTVPLRQEVVSALNGLPHRDGVVFRTPGGREFFNGFGIGGNPIATGFRAACRRAGLGHVRPHDLRHSFTTWRIREGVPLAIVARLRGDRGLQMVMRYSHLAPEDLAAALKAVDVDTKPAHSRDTDAQLTEMKG